MSALPQHLALVRQHQQAARPTDPLLARAQRLWPDSEHNQREGLRAVSVVRRTARGWLLERPVPRSAA